MPNRYALIRYLAQDGKTWRVGSGLIVRDRVVLTADHVANGSGHQVECLDRRFPVDAVVRSGDPSVDLAVLILSGPAMGLEPVPYARVDRSWPPCKLADCVAVGFPFWAKDGGGRTSAQVEGYVRTAEYLRMLMNGEADAQPLLLVGDRVPGEPDIPNGSFEHAGNNPWAGMSGAVVVARGTIIGVISSHNLARGPRSLTVTPLTALSRLPAEKCQEFCAALGVDSVDELTVLTADTALPSGTPALVGAPRAPVAGAALSDKVREKYTDELLRVGLEVPDRWGLSELDPLRRQCRRQATSPGATDVQQRAADALEALWLAIGALPLLQRVGGRVISAKKLRYLYLRHVGCMPDADSLDEMLVLAASVGVTERRLPTAEPAARQTGPLSALARFMLGIASHWKGAGTAALDDPDLEELVDWLTGTLGHQLEDATNYLARRVRRRTWALIELDAKDEETRAWPTGINVTVVPERGDAKSRRFPCASASMEGVTDALRDAVNWLPEGDVYVDLCLPRHWLDAGVEHWGVVDAGGWESLSRHFHPRLRWAMHWHHDRLSSQLRERFDRVDWLADPEEIPAEVVGDWTGFAAWLDARDQPSTRHPPYFTGGLTGSGNSRGHDPLHTLLSRGYGFVTWFSDEAATDALADALHAAAGLSERERRDDLPDILAAKLSRHRPCIIWSDPDGRADFPLPPPRPAGSRRKGRQ